MTDKCRCIVSRVAEMNSDTPGTKEYTNMGGNAKNLHKTNKKPH